MGVRGVHGEGGCDESKPRLVTDRFAVDLLVGIRVALEPWIYNPFSGIVHMEHCVMTAVVGVRIAQNQAFQERWRLFLSNGGMPGAADWIPLIRGH